MLQNLHPRPILQQLENSSCTRETTQGSDGATTQTHAAEGNKRFQVGHKPVKTETGHPSRQGEWDIAAGYIREGEI